MLHDDCVERDCEIGRKGGWLGVCFTEILICRVDFTTNQITRSSPSGVLIEPVAQSFSDMSWPSSVIDCGGCPPVFDDQAEVGKLEFGRGGNFAREFGFLSIAFFEKVCALIRIVSGIDVVA